MRKTLIAAAAMAMGLAAPASGQPSYPYPADPMVEDMEAAIPDPAEIERLAPAMDRVVGSLLEVDVGPIIDATDPYARRPGYGVPGRTIGDMARRDDPWFDDRLRSTIYGSTAEVARMMGALSAAAPALALTLRQMEDAISMAIDDYHRRVPHD